MVRCSQRGSLRFFFGPLVGVGDEAVPAQRAAGREGLAAFRALEGPLACVRS